MIISREDLRFWDVRTRERRLRRGDLTKADVEAYIKALGDSEDKSTVSKPLEEPDERRFLRPSHGMARIIATPPLPSDLDDELDDLDDIDDEEDEDEDEDDDFPLK